MSKTTHGCPLNVQPECNYPQGTCTCASCPGGNYNPETEGQGFMHCLPRICSTQIVAGAACPTNMTCTVCGGGWTCPNGAWVRQIPKRRP
jgi:hypothetical protein